MSTPNIFAIKNRQTHRAPVNPLDKSTIFSILPKSIHEEKCTIQPGVFDIPPGNYAKPAVLIVGPSSWWREIDSEQPLLEITNSSIQIADSVVRDYCNGLLACNMADIMPGLFYLPGEWTADKLKREQLPLLEKAKAGQDKWFHELIKIADILWARSNGNPLSISFDARLACKELNISNKPWLGDTQSMELIRCVACGNLRNPAYPICPHCKAIVDIAKAKELQLTFVQ